MTRTELQARMGQGLATKTFTTIEGVDEQVKHIPGGVMGMVFYWSAQDQCIRNAAVDPKTWFES